MRKQLLKKNLTCFSKSFFYELFDIKSKKKQYRKRRMGLE